MQRTELVSLATFLLGLSSFFLPFAALKENRVVDGITMSAFQLVGPFLGTFSIFLGLALLMMAFFVKKKSLHRYVYAITGPLFLWLALAILNRGIGFLPSGSASRISPAIGFWIFPVLSYILLNQAHLPRRKGFGLLMFFVCLLPAFLILGENGDSVSLMKEWFIYKNRFFSELMTHIQLFTTATLLAAFFGITLGVLASYSKSLEKPLTIFVDSMQTIPSLALFGLLMAPLAILSRNFPVLRSLGLKGIGSAPALIALTLYALLPVLRNTITGLASVPKASIEAGRGMGMSPQQLFWTVKYPLATPHILTGLRTASVQAVGNTTIAALIGAGGLGVVIFQGLGQAAPDLVLLGVLPLILVAVLVDRSWDLLINKIVPVALKRDGESI